MSMTDPTRTPSGDADPDLKDSKHQDGILAHQLTAKSDDVAVSPAGGVGGLGGGGAGAPHGDLPGGSGLSPAEERKLLRKIDWHLVPWLSVLYLVSFLDRSAIGNARLYGLETDLGLTDTQYDIALTVFFIPYALFEIPSNVLLKRLRPSIWLPLIVVLWGVAMLCQGVVKDYGGLVTTRVFLGIFEAGLFPGAQYYLSCWYKRSEFGLRAALFFSAATVSGAFGGLLAAAISNMDGIGGYEGWRWIFIIEGLLSVVVGAISYWLLADFPDNAKFLSEPERKAVVGRLQADQQFSAAGEGFEWRNIWKSLLDWKTWIGALVYMGSDGPLYAFSLFTPSIINALGYKATAANLISVPIYVVACLFTVGVGFLADRYQNRALFNVVFMSIGVAGYIVLIASRNAGVSYFAIYLAAVGIYPLIPNIVAWTGSNTEGAYKRSVSMAFIISWGNLNGAVSSNIYRKQDKPWYSLGHGIVLLYIVIGIVTTGILWFGLRLENSRRARGESDETIMPPGTDAAEIESARAALREKDSASGGLRSRIRAVYRDLDMAPGGVYASVDEARMKKGDEWSGFRYGY